MKRNHFLLVLLVTAINTICYSQQTTPNDSINVTLNKNNCDSIAQDCFSAYLFPGAYRYVISRFGPRGGRMHYGTDLKMNTGDTIFAVQGGTVLRSNWGTGFGRILIIEHENNIQTYYGHLSKFLKLKGEKVKKGEAIALAGSTGNARGPHLHFEMHENGKAFDPELIFNLKKHKIRDEAQHEQSLAVVHKKLRPIGYASNTAVPEYYSVRKGDSLWKISRTYKIPIATICSLNGISANTILQIGKPLRLY